MIELSMLEFWSKIDTFEKIFWYIALPFTIFGFISILLTIFGLGDAGPDVDVELSDGTIESPDSPDAAFSYFSVRNMIMFFAVLGWIGIVGAHNGWPRVLTVLVAVVSGAIASTIFAILFRMMMRLNESGNMPSLSTSVGSLGTVYISIPANRDGEGRIQITLGSGLREIAAVTDGEDLSPGVKVKVTGTLGSDTLIVEKA